MYVIAGVTGRTGRAAADALLDAGEPVRVVLRDEAKGEQWRTKGAEVATASLGDAAALTQAMQGARGAYVLLPPESSAENMRAAQVRIADAITAAVAAGGVGHVVLLSSIGAQHASGVGPIAALHYTEEQLRATGRPVTFLRASYFIENWVGVLEAARTQGVLPSFLPLDTAMEMVATADIGETAARLLRGPAPKGARVIELGGVRPLTVKQLAADLSHVLAHPVQATRAPLEQVVPAFMSFGFSQSASESYREMYEGFSEGRIAYQDPVAPHLRGGRAPIDVLGPMIA